jgi:soluble lytic murein transglycosylase-like protein
LELKDARIKEISGRYKKQSFYAGLLLEDIAAKVSFENVENDKSDETERQRLNDIIQMLYTSSLQDKITSPFAAEKLIAYILSGSLVADEFATLKAARESGWTESEAALKMLALYKTGKLSECVTFFENVVYKNENFKTRITNLLYNESPAYQSGASLSNEDTYLLYTHAIYIISNYIIQKTKSGSLGGALQAAASELIRFFLDAPFSRVHRWALVELREKKLAVFSPLENACITGRFGHSDGAYAQAMSAFNAALSLDRQVLFQHEKLLDEYGRSCIYSSHYENGYKQFSEWTEGIKANPDRETKRILYKTLYYAARLRRAANKPKEAETLFREAVKAAPDAVQSDACIWYIIDINLNASLESGIAAMHDFGNQITDHNSFSDIFDKLLSGLSVKEDWGGIYALYPIIQGGNCGETNARAAYIIARAADSGLLISGVDERRIFPNDYYLKAYHENRAALFDDVSFYYRAMSALRLNRNVDFLPASKTALFDSKKESIATKKDASLNAQFLLEFFDSSGGFHTPPLGAKQGRWNPDCNHLWNTTYPVACRRVVDYGTLRSNKNTTLHKLSIPFIRSQINLLPINETRFVLQKLSECYFYADTIRLTMAMMRRDDYQGDNYGSDPEGVRVDLQLLYPYAYAEHISRFAKQYDLKECILLGLIRTESLFIPAIVSRSGAQGLTQLMESTAIDTAKTIARRGGPDYIRDNGEGAYVDRSDPETNVHIGTEFFNHLLNVFDYPLYAILSYNGGPTRVRRFIRNANQKLPPDLFMETIELRETREYGKKVSGSAAIYDFLYFSLKPTAILADIVGNGTAK